MLELRVLITSKAFRAANGEHAWRRLDIEDALLEIRDSGQASLGGEVWRITGPGQWEGLIPDRTGAAPGAWTWDTAAREATESWPAYCERTAKESIEAVRGIHVEQETFVELVDHLRFNATYIDETEWSP